MAYMASKGNKKSNSKKNVTKESDKKEEIVKNKEVKKEIDNKKEDTDKKNVETKQEDVSQKEKSEEKKNENKNNTQKQNKTKTKNIKSPKKNNSKTSDTQKKTDLEKKDKSKKEENSKKDKEEIAKTLEKKIDELPDDEENKPSKEKNTKEKPSKEDTPKELKKQDSKEIQKKIFEESNENKKRNAYIAIIILVIVLALMIFSTIFAILNLGNSNFIQGVKIKNVDISGLSLEEAKEKVNYELEKELKQEINLKYNDFETIFIADQIEFIYKVDDAITKAYNIGRDGNILQNNYNILLSTFFGKNIEPEFTYNEEYLKQYTDDVESKIPGLVVEPTYYIDDNKLMVESGKDGIVIDKEKLQKYIIDTIKKIDFSKISDSDSAIDLEIPVENKLASEIDFDKIYSEIYTEPQDAYYETDPFVLHPDVNGVDLEISVDEAKKQIESEKKEEYIFDLKIIPASKTIKDLGTEAFPYQISTFTTKYDASNINRSKNLAIAAGKINGTVLLPGEEFSFNKVVGKRTVEEGYKDAKIYADGGVVDGLAGGICQISSTLYNAVLLANLEIVERRNHSFTTSYVPAGRDATVVYGTIDFVFKNSRNYPIKITSSVENGIATFSINGIMEEEEYEIKIIPQTTQTIPYATQRIVNPSLAPGQQVVVQAGHTGCKVTTYKEIRKNGVLISRELLSNDTYKSMSAVVQVGP